MGLNQDEEDYVRSKRAVDSLSAGICVALLIIYGLVKFLEWIGRWEPIKQWILKQ